MFSGIVEGLSEVKSIEKTGKGIRIGIDLTGFTDGLKVGDSISVNGICLTLIDLENGVGYFEVMPETLQKTDLGEIKVGSKVNFERSLRYGDRIGGHFVHGHVDGIGKLIKKERNGEYWKFWIEVPAHLTDMMIEKGSVGLDGVSMTLVDVHDGKFSVCLILHTLKVTTLGLKKEGDTINIEVDQIGKWVKKLLGK